MEDEERKLRAGTVSDSRGANSKSSVCTEGITVPSKFRGDAALYTCSNWDFLFYNSRQYFDYKSIMFDCAWYIYSLAAMAPINKEERRACSG